MAQEQHGKEIPSALTHSRESSLRETREIDELRLVVFSDHHRGQGNGADDFRQNKQAYHAALGYYAYKDFRLFLLGDVEELWESSIQKSVETYWDTLELEKQFVEKQRYVRFVGNHDDELLQNASRAQLDKYIHDSPILDALTIEVGHQGEKIGELFFVHGHQGKNYTLFDRWAVRHLWANLQVLTNIGYGTPAKSFELRREHEEIMYTWVAGLREKVICICGHTHRPVFMSHAWEQSAEQELKELKNRQAPAEQIAMKYAEVEWIRSNPQRKSDIPIDGKPCFFNTGCCSYSDGDITGIEISEEIIRLVKWHGDAGRPKRTVLRDGKLLDILAECGA